MFRFYYSFICRKCASAFHLVFDVLQNGHFNSLIVRLFSFRYPYINGLC